MRRADGEKIAWVRLAGFTSGAHGEVREAVDGLLEAAPKGVVLDLRDNGGGLLNEARAGLLDLRRRGHDRLDRRPQPARAGVRGDGRRDRPEIPVVVLVNREHGVGVGDRHRRAAGPRSRRGRRHADVRQGRLPGDPRALERRRARHHRRRVLHAGRAQPGRRRRQAGRRHQAGRRGRGRPGDAGATRRSTRRSTVARRRRERAASEPRGPRAAPRRRGARAARALPDRRAVLRARAADERRQAQAGQRAGAGDLVLVRAERPARGPRRGRARGSGARTSRATCSRR